MTKNRIHHVATENYKILKTADVTLEAWEPDIRPAGAPLFESNEIIAPGRHQSHAHAG